MGRKCSVGGQALPNGVMLRSAAKTAVAVRRTDGEIELRVWQNVHKKPGRAGKLPLVRGVMQIGTALREGARTYSAAFKMGRPSLRGGPLKKVRMYHGAEHKTVFCCDKGLDLTIENVRIQSRLHPRCGTSLALSVIVCTAIAAAAVPRDIPKLYSDAADIAAVLVGIGAGYEAGRYASVKATGLAKILSAPGLWAQRLTTLEPDDGMIECAIAAAKAVTGQ